MLKTFVKCKLHRVRVTDANIDYKGSISICPELMAASGLEEFELVHINNLSNAEHWETYVIPGEPGGITLNGPPARKFQPGDLVVVLGMVALQPGDVTEHTTVFVDENNKPNGFLKKPIQFKIMTS